MKTKSVKASKEHECFLCCGKILKDERHKSCWGMYAGSPYRFKLHNDCNLILFSYMESGGPKDAYEALTYLKEDFKKVKSL